MVQVSCISELSMGTSNATFNPSEVIIPNFHADIFDFDNSIKIMPKTLTPYLRQVEVRGVLLGTLVIPQSDGSFVARSETDSFCANGQGETEEEALRDIKEAIAILLEETENPSGEVPWPNDYP